MSQSRSLFDEKYYRRYYLNPATRSSTPQADRKLAGFISAYLKYLDIRIGRILDIGCGLGWTLRALSRQHPRARCVGVEHSEYLCNRYRWERGSVTDYQATRPFDLVVCNNVLPSLNDADCRDAIANLTDLTRAVLFLGAMTREDWARCDKRRTDAQIHLRSAAWYRDQLQGDFIALGGGLFAKRDAPITHWSLDCLE